MVVHGFQPKICVQASLKICVNYVEIHVNDSALQTVEKESGYVL